MARPASVFTCSACGAATPRWTGRCPGCATWNTVVAQPRLADPRPAAGSRAAARPSPTSLPSGAVSLHRLGDVDVSAAAPRPTGLPELDAVLAGGLVPGSVSLLGGEPGIGKSTLLLQVLRAVAADGDTAVLLSAEESARQVRLRAERLGPVPSGLLVVPTTDIRVLDEVAARGRPSLVVIDSVQTVADPEVSGAPGSLAQVLACAERAVALAKTEDVTVVLVGHVTKNGALAGPRTLEHLVDTVVTVEGDRHHALRLVRTVKHRFGPTGQLGLFEMGETGLQAVSDPSRLLLGDRRPDSVGSAVAAALDGQRALLVEVQALVVPAPPTVPTRRSAQGLDSGRLAQLLAVLAHGSALVPAQSDVFASVVGGVRVPEPAADLAIALAVASSARGQPVPPDVAVFGEVGLTGEVRQVPGVERRLAAVAAAGFRRAVVPYGGPTGSVVRTVPVRTVRQAVDQLVGSGRGR